MNKEETKAAIAVMQAWAEGKEIEFRNYDNHWVSAKESPNWNWLNTKYRIKPQVIKYRRYLYRSGDNTLILVAQYIHSLDFIEKSACFLRWIDTEWQEVEV